MDTTELAHYCLRVLRVENMRRRGAEPPREVQHCQFTAWPDHGVPTHPTPFLMFLKRVNALNPKDAGPIITHCRLEAPKFTLKPEFHIILLGSAIKIEF